MPDVPFQQLEEDARKAGEEVQGGCDDQGQQVVVHDIAVEPIEPEDEDDFGDES